MKRMEVVREHYKAADAAVSAAFHGVLSCFGVELAGTASTRGWPTVDSPTPLLLLLLLYVGVVTLGLQWIRFAGLKPRTEHREPAPLRALVIIHNCFCLGLSLYMSLGLAHTAYQLQYSVWGNAYNEQHKLMAHFIYVFYMSKLVEFMDTVIMLLKRNVRQVTVLHVYHHVSVALIWWMIAHHAPGGDAYISAAMNSAVHVFMYLYYLLSAIWRNDKRKQQKYLFWGKYLTQLQMIQFVINMLQAFYSIIVQSPYPQFLCKILFGYMISLLILFSNFYTKKYKASSKSHKC